ncbi:MAG: hypothetical protein KKA90_02750 [Nanoarchaeota archaeon]|nr:hypothetical protein [Nanoarchaeota archaeon]
MLRGEMVHIKTKHFTIKTVRSCPTDPDRYLVRAIPTFSYSYEAIKALAAAFPQIRFSDTFLAAKITEGPLTILVFAKGAILVRNAATQGQAVKVIRKIVDLLAKHV